MEDFARRVQSADATQIEVYTEPIKRMVSRVLHGNGITELLQLCRMRLDALRPGGALKVRRGNDWFHCSEACSFGHRFRHRSPISKSVNDRGLTRGRDRCNGIELLSEGRDAVADRLPDRVLLEARIGLRDVLAQASNSSPGDAWMTLPNL